MCIRDRLCIVEADALDDLLQSLLVVGILAILDPLAADVAQDAAEVIVTGVAQEAAAVGPHTHKVAQQAVHLAVHAAQAVVVDLHGNAQTMILLAQMDQDVGLVLLSLSLIHI